MIDGFGRKIEVLRISVTDRCNFRCKYCMPPEGVKWIPHERILRYEQIADIVTAAIGLGITRIRLTGGEPLVRAGLVNLAGMLAELPGIQELAMTTNGSLLAPVAGRLAAAGLQRVNISLDTLDPGKYRAITGGGDLNDVLAGIEAAVSAGLTPVKLNIVVPPEVDDSDAVQVEKFAASKGLITRRIRQMDIKKGEFSVVQNSDRGDCRVCNRLRLTSDGFVRSCLLADIKFDVRSLGPGEAIRRAVAAKPEHGLGSVRTTMNVIGG